VKKAPVPIPDATESETEAIERLVELFEVRLEKQPRAVRQAVLAELLARHITLHQVNRLQFPFVRRIIENVIDDLWSAKLLCSFKDPPQ
jgi:uncharacterized protein (DUF2267 family)